jgi:O-methyltransferase
MSNEYLELLKLALCDLVGSETTTAHRQGSGETLPKIYSAIDPEWLEHRRRGDDWPLTALTMIGLDRLNDLQRCVEQVVEQNIHGNMIECGCWRGGAAMLMRATLNQLEYLTAEYRTVWAADSFQGFRGGHWDGWEKELARYDVLSVSMEEVKASFERLGLVDGVAWLPGYVEDTLPTMRDYQWSLIRLDLDTYHATIAALDNLWGGLSVGGFLILDDYVIMEPIRSAVASFFEGSGEVQTIEVVDHNCARIQRR